MKKIRKRAGRTSRALAAGYTFQLVSNRAINLFGVLVTRGFG
jgi:hypothetical protein